MVKKMKLLFVVLFLISFLTVVECQQNDTELEWVAFGDYLYALVEENTYQREAEKRCVELGGHLVSIHSKEENDFVHTVRRNNSVWLGKNKINDPSINGTYTWTDGSTHDDFAFPWDKRQPNEPWTNCIFMANRPDNRGEWSDYFCNQEEALAYDPNTDTNYFLPIYYTPNTPFFVCKKCKKSAEKKAEQKELK